MVSLLSNPSKSSEEVELIPNEVSHLLDISEHPAVLVSPADLQILAANASFAELSGYTREELLNLHLETLIPRILPVLEDEEQQLALHSLQGRRLDLINRRKQKIATTVKAKKIGTSKRFSIYMLSPRGEPSGRGKESSPDEPALDQIIPLTEIFFQPDLDQALAVVIEVGKRLLQAESLGIYTVASNHPNLQAIKLDNPTGCLPDSISTTDFFTHYKEFQFSPPFKPPHSPLTERSAAKGAAFVTSAPLHESQAVSGMIVAMGAENSAPPSKSTARSVMRLLVAAAAGALHSFILRSNLNDRLSRAALRKAIGDTINSYMPEGVLYLSTDLLIQQVNPSAEQILGYAEQEITHRHIDDVIIGTDRLTPALQDALDGIPTHDLGHLEIHHRDGSAFPALLKTFPVSNAEKSTIQGILIFIQDISKEEKVRIRTQQLERRALVGQMNAIFAHEIRNPINNITSGIQLLDRTLPEDFQYRDVLKGINDDCDRLTHIVDTVLTFSKSQSYHRTPIELAPLIEKILNRWTPRMKRTGVSHVLKAEPNVPRILGDPRALGQVFNNLISNAVRAMEETGGGVLSVRVKSFQKASGARGVQVDVLDTGPGIPAEVQDHIFEPFFTTKPDGTGLGLSITKQIITMHEGTIKLVPLPEGTSFQIVLPGAKEENN